MRLSFPHPILVRSGHVESTGGQKRKTTKKLNDIDIVIKPVKQQQSTRTKKCRGKTEQGQADESTIHMTIRGIFTVRSTDMFDLCFCAATDICALVATLARACATAASNSRTSPIKCLFSRMNSLRSTLLASILLRRSPMRWASAEKNRSA